jgi:hypothetical protein
LAASGTLNHDVVRAWVRGFGKAMAPRPSGCAAKSVAMIHAAAVQVSSTNDVAACGGSFVEAFVDVICWFKVWICDVHKADQRREKRLFRVQAQDGPTLADPRSPADDSVECPKSNGF